MAIAIHISIFNWTQHATAEQSTIWVKHHHERVVCGGSIAFILNKPWSWINWKPHLNLFNFNFNLTIFFNHAKCDWFLASYQFICIATCSLDSAHNRDWHTSSEHKHRLPQPQQHTTTTSVFHQCDSVHSICNNSEPSKSNYHHGRVVLLLNW